VETELKLSAAMKPSISPTQSTGTVFDLIDIGANLTHDSFDADRAAVIDDAASAGVSRMILTGASLAGSQDALTLARQWPGRMYATVGMHPHHAADYSDTVHETFQSMLGEDEVVAVGECGLDYFRNFSPAEAQREAFRRQLELAEQSRLPVFLHQRDSHHDTLEILKPMLSSISRVVAHCFTGTEDELLAYVDLGLYVGITGWICDERRGLHLQDIVKHIPLDRLMLETDAPYLLPRSLRPKPGSRRNEPKYLPEVLRVVAAAMGQDEETIARQTTRNAERFFALNAQGHE
jgi:TatD DNase family protein